MCLIVKEYIEWLKNIKGFSKSTIENYIRAIIMLDEYIKEVSFGERGVEYPHTIEIEDIEWFAERERGRWKQPQTVNIYLSWIKMFLRFCNHKGIQALDFRRVLFAREQEMKIDALDKEEVEMLLNQLKNDNSKDEIVRMRDYAMWLILFYGWLRVSELTSLKVEDIKENMQVIWKGGSRRLVCLYQSHIHVVELYLFLRRRLHINSDYVFVSHSRNSMWKPLSRVTVEDVIRKAWKKVWLKVRPHKLRHSCATQMLENGGNIVYISKILWHKNITTTQAYLDYANSELRKTQMLIPEM